MFFICDRRTSWRDVEDDLKHCCYSPHFFVVIRFKLVIIATGPALRTGSVVSAVTWSPNLGA